jgi:uncharacterized protein YdbL (DUF1318 family)
MPRILAVFAALLLAAAPAAAQSATETVEQAKADGLVGERVDGYLGFVAEQAQEDLVDEVEDINIRRRAAYTRLAEQQGASVEVVARLTAEKLIDNLPAGYWYKNANNQWVQK